jgi:ubiquinone/menaquinone biosynthesis C-methylase UbiE
VFDTILDMRLTDIAADEETARISGVLISSYPTASYADLVALRIKNRANFHSVPPKLIKHYESYLAARSDSGRKMALMFKHKLAEQFGHSNASVALDVGCGTGANLVTLSELHDHVVGIDPSLPNLILARKACEEHGISNVQLIQAYGQHIPYPDGSFGYITALNVLEHVFDIDGVIKEVARVIHSQGGFAADSRNRFDLFFPEPHVKLRWVGLLPRQLARWYVHWRTGLEYNHAFLWSYYDLQHVLRTHFGSRYKITFPAVVAYGGPAWADVLLSALAHIPILRTLVLWGFPSHLVLAQKEEAS